MFFPERWEIGQHLKMELFFTSGSEPDSIDMLVEVVWMDIHLDAGWGDYRWGVKFIDISKEDRMKLKFFLKSLLP